jgi:hypothetical protein
MQTAPNSKRRNFMVIKIYCSIILGKALTQKGMLL